MMASRIIHACVESVALIFACYETDKQSPTHESWIVPEILLTQQHLRS